MSGERRNLMLLVALAGVLALGAALVPGRQRPNYDFLPDMVRQPRFEAFSADPYFPDGKTLREPVPGTVPRGMVPLPYDASGESAARAAVELTNPIPAGGRKVAVKRGEVLFGRLCVPCHGDTGRGDGPVAQRGFPPPASLVAPKARGLSDGRIFHILTYGQGNMPSYATQLTRQDRWNVALFVRSLQRPSREAQERSR